MKIYLIKKYLTTKPSTNEHGYVVIITRIFYLSSLINTGLYVQLIKRSKVIANALKFSMLRSNIAC